MEKKRIIHKPGWIYSSIWVLMQEMLRCLTRSWRGFSCTLLLWKDSLILHSWICFLQYWKRHTSMEIIHLKANRVNVINAKRNIKVWVGLTLTLWGVSVRAEQGPSWLPCDHQDSYQTDCRRTETNVLNLHWQIGRVTFYYSVLNKYIDSKWNIT